MFVDSDEIAEGYRKIDLVGRGKRIEAEPVFEPSDQDGKPKRIQP